MDGRPNLTSKNAFPDFSDAVRVGPNYSIYRVSFVDKDTKIIIFTIGSARLFRASILYDLRI